jgi:hypothetical protein
MPAGESASLRRAQEEICAILREEDEMDESFLDDTIDDDAGTEDDDGDDRATTEDETTPVRTDVDSSGARRVATGTSGGKSVAFNAGSPANATMTPVSARIDAAAKELERRGARLLAGVAEEERMASEEMVRARAAMEEAVSRVASEALDREALERAIATRDLEIFKRDEELDRVKRALERAESSSERVVEEAGVTVGDEMLEQVKMELDALKMDVESADRRASQAEEGAQAMLEAMKATELKASQEKVKLLDEIRDLRSALSAKGREVEDAREASRGNSAKAELESEVEALKGEVAEMTKRAAVAESFAAKLESMVSQKAEELFEATQERDALRRKLKSTSETIESLEREWVDFSRQAENSKNALELENAELHGIIDEMKETDKEGFVHAEMEIANLRERLSKYEDSAKRVDRSEDRKLARESIATLRAKVRELTATIEGKDSELTAMRKSLAHKQTLESVHDEKDEVIKALQQQINGNGAPSRNNPSFDAFATSPVSPQTVDIDALGELEALVSALRRENTELRLELESIDPNVVNERDDLRRRVTSQSFLLSSYEDRLVRYTDALGIPFTPEDRP